MRVFIRSIVILFVCSFCYVYAEREDGRTLSLVPFPRVGRSRVMEIGGGVGGPMSFDNDPSASTYFNELRQYKRHLIPFPRVGKRAALVPFPRVGRAGPGHFGAPDDVDVKRAALIPFPRVGRAGTTQQSESPKESLDTSETSGADSETEGQVIYIPLRWIANMYNQQPTL